MINAVNEKVAITVEHRDGKFYSVFGQVISMDVKYTSASATTLDLQIFVSGAEESRAPKKGTNRQMKKSDFERVFRKIDV
jgi:hypothetical protein